MRTLLSIFLFFPLCLFAQENPENGVAPSKPMYYLLKNAEVIVSPTKILSKASILIKGDKIVEVGSSVSKPAGTVEIDCEGKTIVPAFIELNAEIGIKKADKKPSEWYKPQPESSKKGSYYWNESIHPEYNASEGYEQNAEQTKLLESMGFGFALTHQHDGIARGTGAFVTLGSTPPQNALVVAQATSHFSLDKGSSHQSYPSSQMGIIALLRQTFYDLQWYETQTNVSPNLSLDALKNQLKKPILFETEESLEVLRAQKIAEEFNLIFNYVGSGTEYQQLNALKKVKGSIIVPVSFPNAYEVKDPYLNMEIPLSKLKHWELAPSNPYLLVSNGNSICLSASKCKTDKEFWTNVKKAMSRGLSLEHTIAALTLNPSKVLGVESKVGSLEKDKMASFFIYNSNPFSADAELMEKWILGQQKVIKSSPVTNVAGTYDLIIDGKSKPIEITDKDGKFSANYEKSKAGLSKDAFVSIDKNDVTIQFNDSIDGFIGSVNLHGKINTKLGVMEGEGTLPSGKWIKWSSIKTAKAKAVASPSEKSVEIDSNYLEKIWFPNMAYGFDSLPQQSVYVIKNVTVWTNESEGILKDATVIIENGKISFVGTGGFRNPTGAIEIDGKGMHLTPGIIDEHSHIAISKGVNEGGQAISAEVSIEDVVTNDDINIYRQLAGGVTTSQLLHGSANPIGGQSAIIKLKWGMTPEEMIFPNSPKFIKFALGENVKQSNWGDFQTIRFPQTRMGVEQVYIDAFSRAKEYNRLRTTAKTKDLAPRRDLELDVLVEILNGERNITCHSYVQSEINMLMHVADTFGFKINTFTHILEGYKLADKMLAHGAGGSTFSDWWGYKFEVNDAIPYNATMMTEQGLVVAINSDDAEMGRRLNQEAAKSVKYGGMSEEDALKLVTLNPAKLLHIDHKVGSVKVGKDADLVLWTTNPLSVDAIATKVFIDGIQFYDRATDMQLRTMNQQEKARIISKMLEAKSQGEPTQNFTKKEPKFFHCDTFGEEGSTEHNTH